MGKYLFDFAASPRAPQSFTSDLVVGLSARL